MTGDFTVVCTAIGPAIIPSATCLMSLLHLSHKFRLTGGLSVSGVVSGLPIIEGLLSPVNGNIIAEVEAFLVGI